MTNKEIKKDKASVLAVTMIILGLVLSIALSASLVSILGNKASVSSNKSNLAYSRADSGIENVLLRIKNADPDIDTVANIDTDGNCDGIVNGTNFKVELKDEAGILVSGDCSTKVSEIRSIKSTGIADNNQRSIEVAVAAEGEYQTSCTFTNQSEECCRIDSSTGETKCQIIFPNNANVWVDFGAPFSTGGNSKYNIACEGTQLGDTVVCCRTEAVSGEISCKYAANVNTGNKTWNSLGGGNPSF